MIFSLSTHWNAGRHDNGEAMLEEILGLGFTHVELGYNLHDYHLPGVRRLVASGAVRITSLHNYCPVPPNISVGHPELYTLADPKEKIRQSAVTHTAATLRLAAELGASVVVMHCGNVRMRSYTPRLRALCGKRQRYTDKYERLKLKAILVREKRVSPQLDYLLAGLDQLVPLAASLKLRLGLENLPSWEAIPSETEIAGILRRFGTDHLCYWHDTGHGQLREDLGFSNHLETVRRHLPLIGGMHVHDVRPPLEDHHMPPGGKVVFAGLAEAAALPIPLVLEPSLSIPAESVVAGWRYLQQVWPPQAPAV